jgi:hypothetical protein
MVSSRTRADLRATSATGRFSAHGLVETPISGLRPRSVAAWPPPLPSCLAHANLSAHADYENFAMFDLRAVGRGYRRGLGQKVNRYEGGRGTVSRGAAPLWGDKSAPGLGPAQVRGTE